MIRFLHSSDLHLGKRFGQFPEALRNRLTEARHQSLHRLATAARQAGTNLILLAGDTFDSETPAPATIRQGLGAMGSEGDMTWVLIPGNHDSRAADELWALAAGHLPPNVTLAMAAEALTVAPGVVVLPAPCTDRRPGRDLTGWMDGAPTPEGTVRVGLAHGAVQEFGEDGARDVIDPDRARKAGLDYLALGDWHGQMRIGARTWYSGTPEPDRFKHDGPGRALLVAVAQPGAEPEVVPVSTGAFDWRIGRLDFMPGSDIEALVEALLPARSLRRQSLVQIVAAGRLRLPERAALSARMASDEPDFAWLDLRDGGLELEIEPDDLDRINRGGALRQAADALCAEAEGGGGTPEERAAARGALLRLFSYVADGT